MSAVVLGLVVAAIMCLATWLGLYLRSRLPDHHLQMESKEAIRLATAVVGTLSALALGLLIASAKTTSDEAASELRTSAANVVLMDRLMAHYGPETAGSRLMLRRLLEVRLARGWTPATSAGENVGGDVLDLEGVQDFLRRLTPPSEAQRLLQARLLDISGRIAESRWLTVEASAEGLPWAFLMVLVFWLALLFTTFGLQAPKNPTVICILLACALSVGGAVFVIADMANPYQGLMHISDRPLRAALERLAGPEPAVSGG